MTLTPTQLLEGMARAYSKAPYPSQRSINAIKEAIQYLIEHAAECDEALDEASDGWEIEKWEMIENMRSYLTVLVEAK